MYIVGLISWELQWGVFYIRKQLWFSFGCSLCRVWGLGCKHMELWVGCNWYWINSFVYVPSVTTIWFSGLFLWLWWAFRFAWRFATYEYLISWWDEIFSRPWSFDVKAFRTRFSVTIVFISDRAVFRALNIFVWFRNFGFGHGKYDNTTKTRSKKTGRLGPSISFIVWILSLRTCTSVNLGF